MLHRGAGRLGRGGDRPIAGGRLRRAAMLGVLVGAVCLSGASAALAAPAFTQVGAPTATGGNPYSVAFSPDGSLLATTSVTNGTVTVYAVSAGGALSPVGVPASTGLSSSTPVSVAFSPSGRLLATANENTGFGTISVFTVSAGGTLTPVAGSPFATGPLPRGVAFSPNGSLLATANDGDGTVSVFAVSAGGVLTPSVGSPTAVGSTLFSLAFSPDSSLLATGDSGPVTVSMFSVASGGGLTAAGTGSTGVNNQQYSIAFSPNGRLLATTNHGDYTVSMFAVSAGGTLTPIGTPTSTGTQPDSLAFSPVGDLLAIANQFSNNISLFSVSAGGGLSPVGAAIATGVLPRAIAFGPTGTLLATVNSTDNTISMFSGGGPTARISAPADQQTFAQNQTAATSFACSAPAGSGAVTSCLDSHDAPSPSGTLDTSTLGAHAYTVTATSNDTLTSSTTIHYTVTAAPASTTTPTTSAPTTGTPSAPGANACPTATGRLSGNTLGLIKLGMTRAQTIVQYGHSSTHGRHDWEYFCLRPRPIRAGFASARLLTTLSSNQQKKLRGHVVLALTANPFYALKGVRPGTSLRTAAKELHTGAVIHVGRNDWYMARDRSTTAIIKVRNGTVKEIGIAIKRVTRTRRAQRTFITSFS